ncbi:cystathionine gamma-synthase [Bdellovibrio bacteriovorus]|uniref:L-methionine gamma-lyase n=1 Tax=Bdellovibrio bacteriovorus TaxID=959 RepID=A0A150WJZ7_BDEBC|nr:cystathionine gamma-synthase [Bdellovibrio bacteriovorus]KYG64036.1 cystathionine gamma-synthase [Bdellovibrio bacteriovorus]
MSSKSFQTLAATLGMTSDTQFGAVTPPLHLSTNFTFDGLGRRREYDNSRSGNPTRDLLADAIAKLENGYGAIVTSSGMSALTLLTHILPPQAHVLAPHDCFGGTHRLLTALEKKGVLSVSFIDFSDLKELERDLIQGADLVLVESPSNPLLRIVDLKKIGDLCKEHDTLYAVDNTFLSPALQRPIELGANLVIHSTTKYLNGHSDVVGGAIVADTQDLHSQLTWWANCTGLTGTPFDSYLTLRGIRTLFARMRTHLENSAKLVNLLTQHPAVKKVYYPGLESHPGHHLAKEQQSGFGAVISFEVQGGIDQVKVLLEHLKLFTLAESLGGVESLVAHPATMTHASMTAEARKRAGISDQLLRLSVGIEDGDDLLRDLKKSLDEVQNSRIKLNQAAAKDGLLPMGLI